MNIEELRAYCLKKPGTSEGFPFGEDTLVFKVAGKMFALTHLNQPELRVNLKCEPERAAQLRENYPAVQPGYHMSKKHWNTVYIDGSISREQIGQWIDDSYTLVANSLPKKQRDLLNL